MGCSKGKPVDETKSSSYYKKNNKIYYHYTGNLMPIVPITYSAEEELNADAESFILLDRYWGKDKNHVFYKYSVVEVADPKTFRIESNNIYRDDKHIYRYENMGWTCRLIPVKNIDARSYIAINNYWGKDKNHVFCHYYIVDVADPETFRIDSGNVYRDDKHIYRFESTGWKTGELIPIEDL